MKDELAAELAELRAGSLYRRTRPLDAFDGRTGVLDGRPVLVFGSNDYLGLSRHPKLTAGAFREMTEAGAGGTGSRLTSGTTRHHEWLEQQLAALKGAEAALLFSSGYLAALGTIPALAGRADLILSDALNHACLIDACRLSRAEVRIYRHADVEHARELLADRSRFRRCLVVTDAVFSMDGDLAPLPQLAELCESSGSWLMVDDAHGTGVLGKSGAGTVEHFGLEERVHVQMATLSKALASQGGFIAGSRELIDLLRNRARSFIFSTALCPPSVGSSMEALELLRREPERLETLRRHSFRLRQTLREGGVQVPEGITPIIPVIIGDEAATLSVSAALEERGIWVPAIRPPTVPPGTARLRISLSAAHLDGDLDALASALVETI